MEPTVPFEAYLLSLRADDAMALVILAVCLGCASGLAIAMLAFGWLAAPRSVSPRMEG